MRNRYLMFVLVGATLPLSGTARTQDRPAGSNSDELRELGSTLDFIRTRSAADYAISTPNGIDEARYLKVGGIEQWVTIRGEDRANPVVLVLHGGPGDATNPWGHAGFRPWLKTYTVVQWDQRGAGENARPEWTGVRCNADHRSARAGRRRTSGRSSHVAAERQNHPAGALVGLCARRVDGQGEAGFVLCVRRNRAGG